MKQLVLLLGLFIALGAVSCQQEEKKTHDAVSRSWYKHDLRERFLDDGLDVQVAIEGEENDTLILTFPLFNDVWARKFETNGSYQTWQEMGFKRVILHNGRFDYKHEQELEATL